MNQLSLRLCLGGAALALSVTACPPPEPSFVMAPPLPPPRAASLPSASVPALPPEPAYNVIDRETFNRAAVRLNLPLYWIADANKNGMVDPDELAALLFYPTDSRWSEEGKFTSLFRQTYPQLVTAAGDPGFDKNLTSAEVDRRKLVIQELDQARPTLVRSDFRTASEDQKTLVAHMLMAAKLVDALFAKQKGLGAWVAKVPADDPASQSLFRRNWGPKCLMPKSEKNPACSAIPDAPRPICDVYPAEVQTDGKFCEAIEKHADAKKLLDPFVVVRSKQGKLVAVSYHEAYTAEMDAIATALRAAVKDVQDAKEAPLKAYLEAAAQSFATNDWRGADEAWAKMTSQNSQWYVRVAPDEVYWEPCSHKAGFHLTFARINADSLQWQAKLAPVQQEMEKALAARIGGPYKERKVTFHLPDFVDIVFNAGDDRSPMGATIGQSLPNWGPIVAQGRGRTVAMSNLYSDPDSLRVRRAQAESVLDRSSMDAYSNSSRPGLLGTILHEATHNLGPVHEYRYKGKTDAEWFGGALSAILEELKAQTGALWYVEFALKKGIISAEFARQSYVDSFVWALNHVSRGMVTDTGKPKPYSQLAAIQVGYLIDEGAVAFDAEGTAANGIDRAAFHLDFDKLPGAIDKLFKVVGTIKATGDRAGAEALVKKYVDGAVVPHKLIAERMQRYPAVSFVYSVER